MNELIKIDSCILTLDKKSFSKLLPYVDGRYNGKRTKVQYLLLSISFSLVNVLMNSYCDEGSNIFACVV